MIEVELSRIIIDEEKKEQVIVLREKKGSRMLPIVIGMSEAAAIKMKLSEFEPPRPLTHDLVCMIITRLGARLDKMVIDELIDGTFHAKLHLAHADGVSVVDARPSDSIAIALRTKSPMFVAEKVLGNVSP